MKFNQQYNKIINQLTHENFKLALSDLNDRRAIVVYYIHGNGDIDSSPQTNDDEYFYQDWDNNFREYGAYVAVTTQDPEEAQDVLIDTIYECEFNCNIDNVIEKIKPMLELKGVFKVINDVSNANSIAFAVDIDITSYKQGVLNNALASVKDNPGVNALFKRHNNQQ